MFMKVFSWLFYSRLGKYEKCSDYVGKNEKFS